MTASLFDRLGGKDAINAAVDLFYEKVMADPSINHFFEDVDMNRQRAKQKAFMTFAFGGIPTYAGVSMRKAHAHLDLTDDHFDAVGGHLKATLEELGVPADLIDEALTIVVSTKDDVLNK